MVKIDDFVWIMGEVFIVCRQGGALIDIETVELAEQFRVKVEDIPLEICDVLLASQQLNDKMREKISNVYFEIMSLSDN
jgi:hypothetical protein